MAILGIFKTNREKIHHFRNSQVDNFPNHIFNGNIRTFDSKSFNSLCEEYIRDDKNFSELKIKVRMAKEYNQKVMKYIDFFDHSLSNLNEQDKVDYFINLRNEYKTIDEVDNNYQQDMNETRLIFNNFDELNLYIKQTYHAIKTFNLYNQDIKFITDDVSVLKPSMNINQNKTVKEYCEKVNEYIIVVNFLKEYLNNKYLQPYVEEIQEFKDYWLNMYPLLSLDNFTRDIYSRFMQEQYIFQEYKDIACTILSYHEDVKTKLNNLKMRVGVNNILEDVFLFKYSDYESEFKSVLKLYAEQKTLHTDIVKKYAAINSKLLHLDRQYSELISPVLNVVNMLDISKENEVEDIKDYYIYSLSKSVERRMNIYGSSKNVTKQEVDSFIILIENKLYKLTNDQRKAIYEAVEMLNYDYTASCLIQGDVSSGKTIVTVALMFILALKGMESVYIVPRKILRAQHLKTLRDYNELFELNLKIYDASEDFDITEADIVLNGFSFSDKKFREIDFEIGFIDEIQLFGVEQRNQVQSMYPNIDMFYTTATPHPRTKLISLIGNIDIIEIREMPPGRKPKKTEAFISFNKKHEQIIRQEVSKGHMTLVVCPLVNKPGSNPFESLPTAYAKYKELFPDLRVEKLMSNMSDDKKDQIILDCVDGNIDILVASKTIEVGIDIPRASVIFIHYPFEMKIKWGVSQLHQLRGRVGRNNQDSFCFIEAPAEYSEKSPIGSVLKTQDVFELTKDDFDWRGFEKIIGTKQSGTSGSKNDQIKRVKAYELIAKNTPNLVEGLDDDFIKQLEESFRKKRLVNIN